MRHYKAFLQACALFPEFQNRTAQLLKKIPKDQTEDAFEEFAKDIAAIVNPWGLHDPEHLLMVSLDKMERSLDGSSTLQKTSPHDIRLNSPDQRIDEPLTREDGKELQRLYADLKSEISQFRTEMVGRLGELLEEMKRCRNSCPEEHVLGPSGIKQCSDAETTKRIELENNVAKGREEGKPGEVAVSGRKRRRRTEAANWGTNGSTRRTYAENWLLNPYTPIPKTESAGDNKRPRRKRGVGKISMPQLIHDDPKDKDWMPQ